MTNDELEAVRARVEMHFQDGCYRSPRADYLCDIPALLDEVERLRSRAAPDPCEAQVPFDTPDGVTWFPAPLGSADPFDRATRAEAHAERLAGALELIARTGDLPTSADSGVWMGVRTYAWEALSAYRGVRE